VNIWLRTIHDWLLPRVCQLCLDPTRDFDLCGGCRQALPRISKACKGCGIPLTGGARCGRCLKRPPPFDCVAIPYVYAPPLSQLIVALKFHRQLTAAAPLGVLLANHLMLTEAPLPERIVPVPLHPARQRARGFNQAMEIARPLSARLGVALAPRLVCRFKPTAPQTTLLSPAERRHNVRGVFTVNAKRMGALRHVAIVDDVVTTGATSVELARALRRAGAEQVDLWSVSRALES
jgi:ComF family protein